MQYASADGMLGRPARENTMITILRRPLARLFASLLAIGLTNACVLAITWSRAQRQSEEWFRSDEGQQVVENVLLYQFPSGGWPKNIDMAEPLSEAEKRRLANRRRDESTIDNGGTYTQLRFLARAYSAEQDERVREAFLKGLDYLLDAQYENGGWPMFHPPREGYTSHIDFNDNAMSGAMMLMDDVAAGEVPFAFVDAERRERAAAAFAKGIECILKCQVVAGGERTVWCAQHDENTFAPAPARAFEPVSLSGHESVGLVRCLMRVDHPSPEIVAAVRGAVNWFNDVKLEGIRVVSVETPEGRDRAVKEDATAPPIWARFYEIGTNRPIFTGRSKVVHYRYDQIERERRMGYAYYGDWPEDLLRKEYPAWAKEWGVTAIEG
jgi:PelA/Pel-15E family pectate lyase